MNIILINKANTGSRPPVISVLYILSDLGFNVKLITCKVSMRFKEMMNKKNIEVFELPYFNNNSFLGKIKDYLLFRYHALKLIKKNYGYNSLIWIADVPTVVALGSKIKKYRYKLQIQELHEESKFQLKAISKVIHNAETVFMPEYNRTIIYQIWFGLEQRPIVLPNKPYFIPKKSELQNLIQKNEKKLSVFKGKKVILYQGGIYKERLLENITQAVSELYDNFMLLLVGKEQEYGYIDELRKIDNSIIHVPYLPAPDYLVYSTVAYMGWLGYSATSLNNAYCAPNKIYEYSAFSLPMIGNDVPGLRTVFESTKSGIIVDQSDVQSIKRGIIAIDINYKKYKTNSSKIYQMSDNNEIIKKSLQKNDN